MSAHALGLAASQASGVVANFGSMAKPLHIGRANEGGLLAVEWAQLGLDASPDALDGRAGLLCAMVGPADVDAEAPVAEDFESMLLRQPPGIKQYPVCYAAQRVVDGVLDLAREHGLRPEDVEAADATISPTTAGVLRHHAPVTVTEARFSLEFVVAAALAHHRLGVHEVSAATLEDPAVRALMARVRTHTADTRCPLEPSFAYTDQVRLTLRDGRVLDSGPIRFARGHAQRPLTPAQVEEKLLACVGPQERPLAERALARIDAALGG